MRHFLALSLAAAAAVSACSDPTPPAPQLQVAAPPCSDPAPLNGTYDPRAPQYLVLFHTGVVAQAEAPRLASVYHFTLRHVWTAGLSGFSAQLTPATVASLRCEPTVASLEYDAIATTQ